MIVPSKVLCRFVQRMPKSVFMLRKCIVPIRSVGSRIPCLYASFLLFVLGAFAFASVFCVQICGRAVVDDYHFRIRTLLTIGLRALGQRLRLLGWHLIARTSILALLIAGLFRLLQMNMPVTFLDPLKLWWMVNE